MKKSLILGTALLIVILMIAEFYLNQNSSVDVFSPRTLVIAFMVLFSYFISRSWTQSLSIYGKVKIIFALNLLLGAIYYFCALSSKSFFDDNFNILGFIILMLDLTYIGVSLRLVHELIIVQRKKSTTRNFVLFLVFLFSFSFFVQPDQFNTTVKPSFPFIMGPDGFFPSLLTTLMIFGMVINSFRLKWIKFLNKGQKIKTLFQSSVIILISTLLISKSAFLADAAGAVSFRLFASSVFFLNIYFSFTIILILLYLPTAGILDRKAKELASLQQLSRSMLGVFDLNKVFDIILQQTIEITGSNFSWLILKEEGKKSFQLVAENGMDWMYLNCSATAQRGALDWKPKFKKAVMPVFKEIYRRVKSGEETKRVLTACGKPNYQEQLAKELKAMADSEMWLAGKATRALRPKEVGKKVSKTTRGVSGRKTY